MSDYVWATTESRRKQLLRKKAEREAQEEETKRLAESMGHTYEPPPAHLGITLTGEFEETITVPSACTGLLIGKKGENLKEAEKRFKVKISVNKEKDTNGDTSAVIVGKSSHDVSAAVRELDFVSDIMNLQAGTVGWATGKSGRHLNYVKELTGVPYLRLAFDNEDVQQTDVDEADNGGLAIEAANDLLDEGADATAKGASKKSKRSGPCWLEIKGRRENVADARLCLEAHVSYFPVYKEMEEVERQLDEELSNKVAVIGYRPSKSRGASFLPNGGGVGRNRSQSRTRSQSRGAEKRDSGVASSSPPPRSREAIATEPSTRGRDRGKGDASKGRGKADNVVQHARPLPEAPSQSLKNTKPEAEVAAQPPPAQLAPKAAQDGGGNGLGRGSRWGTNGARTEDAPGHVTAEPDSANRRPDPKPAGGSKKDSRRWVPKDDPEV